MLRGSEDQESRISEYARHAVPLHQSSWPIGTSVQTQAVPIFYPLPPLPPPPPARLTRHLTLVPLVSQLFCAPRLHSVPRSTSNSTS
ncbi:hypothetical protein CC85DRAFT_96675 [Cutaneotrichosporon oleaginosum]|uniref:Uncharacterized protein n=1 Tax=Cutaneotrichosporon oleaginosum TaxID=879819 RepID=A0A0J0XM62_9TREE|nr:uncharacterized protein CC85DRAFT_96675 [Cutaneotrichosporon oleaginosum]KLT42148.1 hypothetical protein CC85DRAFT_96675 [Cutaneotrichosporon oleaginosum]TXT11727.1 hypothetical protein COLE_02137 [Cutaneotrichosporon oleaginosum]